MPTKWKKLSARCSVNSEQDQSAPQPFRGFVLGGALLFAALGGAVLARFFSIPPQQKSTFRRPRPIVQIIRQQPGLPDLADLIDRLCPSIAIIVPRGSDIPSDGATPFVPASEYSADGWVVTSAQNLPPMPLDAVFGDGRRVDLSDLRIDPVSGLAIVKAALAAPALSFSDQTFPRVGQFGFTLATPVGAGCSSSSSMIGSDFLADGGCLVGYARLESSPDGWRAGAPLLGSDGRVLGIGIADPAGAVIPAPIASVILDELIRNRLSPSTSFGFRAVDYVAPLSARIGNVRSGAGVALVEPKSAAARADLRAGDIITAVDDLPVSSASELSRALDGVQSKATLMIQRRSQQLTLRVTRTNS
jgi:S1-C subfamily serine protease